MKADFHNMCKNIAHQHLGDLFYIFFSIFQNEHIKLLNFKVSQGWNFILTLKQILFSTFSIVV